MVNLDQEKSNQSLACVAHPWTYLKLIKIHQIVFEIIYWNEFVHRLLDYLIDDVFAVFESYKI